MLRHYLSEQEKVGTVRLTRRTLDVYRDIGRSYTSGGLFGTLVFAERDSGVGPQPFGFALAGEDFTGLRLDTTLGRVAFVWLVWVTPSERQTGAGLAMLLFGRPRLLELGFETASLGVREGNTEGHALSRAFGATVNERQYLFPLKEAPGGRPEE